MTEIDKLTVCAFDFHMWKPAPPVCSLWMGSTSPHANHFYILEPDTLHNYFWHHLLNLIAAINQIKNTDLPRYLLPRRCRPKNFKIRFTFDLLEIDAETYATVLLWPFGWSSIVEFNVRKMLGIEDVRDVIRALPSGSSPHFIEADGSSRHLSDIFSFLAQSIKSDVAGNAHVSDILEVPRRVFLRLGAVGNYSNRRYYDFNPDLGIQRWTDSERSRLHSALLGRDISVAELNNWEQTNRAIQMRDSTFSITYPNQGSLLLVNEDKTCSSSRDRQHCLTANLRNCMVTTTALAKFAGKGARYNLRNEWMLQLADCAAATLESLPDHYTNPFCQHMLEKLVGKDAIR